MKRLYFLLISVVLMCSLCACQNRVETSKEAPDEQVIIENATAYFNKMLGGDLETLYNDLPNGVKEKTSLQTMQDDWDEETQNAGGLPDNPSPKISCYTPEKSEQIRVEFVIPCENNDFKVFINYLSDGSLYNYVIWQNSDN